MLSDLMMVKKVKFQRQQQKKTPLDYKEKKFQTHTLKHRMKKKISSSQMNAKKCVKPAIIEALIVIYK